MGIIVVRPGAEVRRLEREVIAQENYLQEYLQKHPEALPLDELKPGGKLLVLAREFATASGPIDALAIDGDGAIYVVETKLYKNADKRRVIAQMLDYGAALWGAGVEAFMAQALLHGELQTMLADRFGLDEDDVATAMASIEANIEAGRFNFIVLMDQLDERLKQLIRFVNENSRFTILGVELDFYKDGDLDILIPHLYGAEVRKAADGGESRRSGRRWTESEYFARAADHLTPEQMEGVHELYAWAQAKGQIGFATGTTYGGFTVQFPTVSARPLFKVTAQGAVVIRVSRLGEVGEAFRDWLQATGVFAIHSDRKKPAIDIDEWLPVRDRFFRAVEEFVSRRA
ncbi:MAG TPA: hypothetical protein VF701_09650 [Thermoanaerobaculia bacterium]